MERSGDCLRRGQGADREGATGHHHTPIKYSMVHMSKSSTSRMLALGKPKYFLYMISVLTIHLLPMLLRLQRLHNTFNGIVNILRL